MKIPEAGAYGGVIINDQGLVLLREPVGHFGGYYWTFAKGGPEPGETPQETAVREVLEETGHVARVVALIPGFFAGTTSSTVFFLMEPDGIPRPFDGETARIRWADEHDARRLIDMSESHVGRQRDLAVLEAAFTMWRSRASD